MADAAKSFEVAPRAPLPRIEMEIENGVEMEVVVAQRMRPASEDDGPRPQSARPLGGRWRGAGPERRPPGDSLAIDGGRHCHWQFSSDSQMIF